MRKVLGILLSLTIISTFVSVPAWASTETNNGIDIAEIPGGQSFFGQNFDGFTEGAEVTTSMGFSNVSHNTNAKYVIATDPVSGGNNKVVKTKPLVTYVHIDAALKAQFDASSKSVKIGSTT